MLGDLISGSEKSALVLLEDVVDPDLSGDFLLVPFIQSLGHRLDLVVLLCFEKLPEFYTSVPCLKELGSKLQVDRLTDIEGWGEAGTSTLQTNLKEVVARHLSPSTKSVAVVIDSLTFHLLSLPPSSTCQMLAHLKKAKFKGGAMVEQVVCRLHRDLHPVSHLALVHHGIPTHLSFSPLPSQTPLPPSTPTPAPDVSLLKAACSTCHVRPCGKVIRVAEEFVVDTSFKVKVVGKVDLSKCTEVPTLMEEPDPAANLTFNLTLTESERQARSNVMLPYTQAPARVNAAEPAEEGGKVFYLADDADDFDEEDPDDDLDI